MGENIPYPLEEFKQYQQYEQKLEAACAKYEIGEIFRRSLTKLANRNLTLLCDDSGSMSTMVDIPPPQHTRWSELVTSIKTLVDIITPVQQHGLDIHFLNRPTLLNVETSDDAKLQAVLQQPPKGYTPTRDALLTIFAQANQQPNTPHTILVFTDGEPTTPHGQLDHQGLLAALQQKPKHVTITFIMCTDDDKIVEYFNNLDKRIPNLDVCDDYRSERAEVLKAQGANFHFSFGEYLIKCALGSFDAYFDHLDEVHINKHYIHYNRHHTTSEDTSGCCIIL